MRGLLILDAALAALMVTIAVVLGVVCILYAVYVGESPKIAAELPLLLLSTAVFVVLGAAWGGALFAVLRRRAWLWPMHAMAVAALIGSGLLLYSRYTS